MIKSKLKLKSLPFLFLLVGYLFLFPKAVSAHQLQTDRNIGAVLHVDPDDDPIVNQTATFFFDFKDKANQFKPQNCTCNIRILQGSQELYNQPLFGSVTTADINTPLFTYTFNQKGVYQIQVTGTPNNSGSFQPFTLNYDLRVDRENTGTSPSFWQSLTTNHFIFYLVFGIILLILFGFIFNRSRVKQNSKADSNPKPPPLTCFITLFISLVIFTQHGSVHNHNPLAQTDHSTAEHLFLHPCCLPQTTNVATIISIEPNSVMQQPIEPSSQIQPQKRVKTTLLARSPPQYPILPV